jgi:signal transduction histidine kinase
MQGMVNSVLAYFRGLEDQEAAQAIDMEALLFSLVEDEQALGRPVRLRERAPGAPPLGPLVGRLSLLRRAVANLIDNAAAHAPQVTVAIEAEPGHLNLVVEDNGPGIPPEQLDRVLEPYVRLDPARSMGRGGVGLGLAITRDAMACHGGQLRLENRSGGGLRAVLRLPLLGSGRNLQR